MAAATLVPLPLPLATGLQPLTPPAEIAVDAGFGAVLAEQLCAPGTADADPSMSASSLEVPALLAGRLPPSGKFLPPSLPDTQPLPAGDPFPTTGDPDQPVDDTERAAPAAAAVLASAWLALPLAAPITPPSNQPEPAQTISKSRAGPVTVTLPFPAVRPVPATEAPRDQIAAELQVTATGTPPPVALSAERALQPGKAFKLRPVLAKAAAQTSPDRRSTAVSEPLAQRIAVDSPALVPAVSSANPGIAAPAPNTASQAHTPTDQPQDFAALIDRLVQAREAAQPQPVHATVNHADFGRVSLRFESDDTGLSVAMAAADPDFARAAQAAVPPSSPANGTTEGTGQRADSRGPAQPQPQGQSQGQTQQHPRSQPQTLRDEQRADRAVAPAQDGAPHRRRGGIFA